MDSVQGTQTEKTPWDTVCQGTSGVEGHLHAKFERSTIDPIDPIDLLDTTGANP